MTERVRLTGPGVVNPRVFQVGDETGRIDEDRSSRTADDPAVTDDGWASARQATIEKS